ncbi:hypothetical protein [Asaia lannensis]
MMTLRYAKERPESRCNLLNGQPCVSSTRAAALPVATLAFHRAAPLLADH